MFNIYRIFLTLLHITCTIINLVNQAWADIQRRYLTIVKLLNIGIINNNNNINEQKTSKSDDTAYLITSIKTIHKNQLPSHIVLILGREPPSFFHIVKFIGWCVTAGIPCVSFYDYNGVLRKSENEARKELAKSRPELVDYIDWNPKCPVKAVKNGMNGAKHKMQVQLLSHADGKKEVALLAQSLGKGVISGALKVEEIVQELLENKLQLGGLPDPDLAIVCGKTCSTYGLLPWHIRTTEFLLLDTHRDFKVTEFVHLLEKYAKCEQRYGK